LNKITKWAVTISIERENMSGDISASFYAQSEHELRVKMNKRIRLFKKAVIP
jgi:hypothetical protein